MARGIAIKALGLHGPAARSEPVYEFELRFFVDEAGVPIEVGLVDRLDLLAPQVTLAHPRLLSQGTTGGLGRAGGARGI